MIIFDKAKFLEKMDFPHDLRISNAAYIITVMRFSCSYFCFRERRLVIMLKARCLSSSPIPKYRFWYSYFAVKNVQRWTRIWKKTPRLWALKMRHSSANYLWIFFKRRTVKVTVDIHITSIFPIFAFVNARMDKFLSNIPVQLNLSAAIYLGGCNEAILGF